ncbi:ABC transporter [Lachnospiraceae bacterium oral taxon 096]|jgi:macrolide export ATP-binding/permease protein macB|nr:ABC transporter [Lachnospiraceae bacterium oral taxon 096]QUI96559.1 ATP-binding cassette domain-containing protein [Lachnospiraceae bacterium oral taxon 096]
MRSMIDIQIEEKIFTKSKLSILKGFSMQVEAGEKLAIVGESGVGKSSLLNILGLLDRDYRGEYYLFGEKTNGVDEKVLAKWRNQRIGFVLQESAMINSLTVEKNIQLPFLYMESKDRNSLLENFTQIVKEIGIESILQKKPLDCSGGERARAVFARGILMKPEVLLADEPTSSLDTENKERIIHSLFEMNQKFGTTIITVTHDLDMAKRHDRVIRLEK